MDLTQLETDLKIINLAHSTINAGGCGEFAKLLGAKFKQSNLKFKYILISDNGRPIKESLAIYKSLGEEVNDYHVRNDNGFDVCHIMVYYKGKFIDSTGIYDTLENSRWKSGRGWTGYKLSAILTEETLNNLCSQKYWNPEFKRKQLPEIANKVNSLNFNNYFNVPLTQ